MRPARRRALRLLAEEYVALIDAPDPGPEVMATITLLGAVLANCVPELLDELDRLDRRGGIA